MYEENYGAEVRFRISFRSSERSNMTYGKQGGSNVYNVKGKKAEKIEAVTFSDLGMLENDIEEILRCSVDMLCDDEDSMLIVGRQVKNDKLGRSDLTAVDNNGNIVLIEIKRDRKDIESRKEAFEFQAIRYAASYATIESPDDLVKKYMRLTLRNIVANMS